MQRCKSEKYPVTEACVIFRKDYSVPLRCDAVSLCNGMAPLRGNIVASSSSVEICKKNDFLFP